MRASGSGRQRSAVAGGKTRHNPRDLLFGFTGAKNDFRHACSDGAVRVYPRKVANGLVGQGTEAV